MDGKYYTNERSQQIVIALLKAHGIRKVVASPGTTNITLVGSMQQDPYFEMYSSVDERSAAYIACGLAAESGEPVVLSCTGATASRNYLPGYMNSEVRTQIVQNALRLDSLQKLLHRQDLYIANIQDIFRGEVKADTVQSIDSLTYLRRDSLMERTQREMDFRRRYEENEKYNLTTIAAHPEVEGLNFYRPTRGVVMTTFNPNEQHFGIDIAATPDESVLATLDGTVILSAYTAETGYVIQIQHSQDLISIYKHCNALLKREGDTVKGGEAIALAGSTGMQATAPHLHFELWHKGQAVNPERYIVF